MKIKCYRHVQYGAIVYRVSCILYDKLIKAEKTYLKKKSRKNIKKYKKLLFKMMNGKILSIIDKDMASINTKI